MYLALAVLVDCLTFSGFDFLYNAVARFLDFFYFSRISVHVSCISGLSGLPNLSGFVALYVAEAFCQYSLIFSGFKFLYFLL